MFQKASQNNNILDDEKLLEKYKYQDIKLLSETPKSLIYLLIGENNQKFVIKKSKNYQTESEVNSIKLLKSLLDSKYKSILPNITYTNTKRGYFVYKYIEGDTFGNFSENYGICHSILNHAIIQTIFDFIKSLENNSKQVERDNLSRSGKYKFDNEMSKTLNQLRDVLDKNELEAVSIVYNKLSKFAKINHVISHMDYYPNNFIKSFNNPKLFCLLDWEMTSTVSVGYSFAFLYLILWREEYWKYMLFGMFYRHYASLYDSANSWRIFSATYRLFVIVLSVRMISQLVSMKNKVYPDYNFALNSFKYELNKAIKDECFKQHQLKFIIGKEDIENILSNYSLGKLDEYKIYYTGHGNSVIRVKIGGIYYILRIYSTNRKLSMIKREVAIFNLLYSNGIPTYRVYNNNDNVNMTTMNMYGYKRHIVLLSYVKGTRIAKRWANTNAAYKLGKMLYLIHKSNVIHGDFSKENVLFFKSIPVGVIDFEWGRITKSKKDKLSDLSRSLMLWLVDSRYKNIDDKLFVRNFIYGYYGYNPNDKIKHKLYEKIIEKIINEVSIVTLDDDITKHRRFSNAVLTINELISETKL